MPTKRALVVCNGGGIGDVFVATPVMRALRMRFDHVTALTARAHRDVIAPAAADAVWIDDRPLPLLLARLRAAKFDAAVVTWATARTAVALWAAGIPRRVGQARRLYSPLFTTRLTLASELGDHRTPWVQILLNYARALDCDDVAQPVSIVDDAARLRAASVLERLGIARGAYLVLHPSRGISAARAGWPETGFARLAQALHERFALPVIITGGAAERESAERIARRGGGISIAGAVTLPEFAAIAEGALAVIAMDSGPMHLAAATGVPTVGIFAMRPDEPDRWHPIGARTAVVRCVYPCPAWHTKERCPDFACVRELDARHVVAAVDGLLAIEHEPSM